jgi:thioredoxin 1
MRTILRAALLLALTLPAAATAADAPAPLPKLIDLGADKCIPCKKMAPLLVELRADYAGLVDVVFIDVWKDKDAGEPYHLRLIPTQVFLDREGKEVFRHEGFFPREEIEKIFQEKFGVEPVPRGKGQGKS